MPLITKSSTAIGHWHNTQLHSVLRSPAAAHAAGASPVRLDTFGGTFLLQAFGVAHLCCGLLRCISALCSQRWEQQLLCRRGRAKCAA